jgi:hypothetical protein
VLAREYGFPGWKDLLKEVKQRLGEFDVHVLRFTATCLLRYACLLLMETGDYE